MEPLPLSMMAPLLTRYNDDTWQVRLAFYSLFTSHVEVATTLACDGIVACHLLYDWAASASTDYSLRLNLNRLRSGHFAIASRPDARPPGSPRSPRPHAD